MQHFVVMGQNDDFGMYMKLRFSVERHLTLSQTTNFRLIQIERFCRRQLKFDKNDRQFSDRVENTVGKREIAHYEQFLLFPQCFQKT